MVVKAEGARNGHELAPLNGEGGQPGQGGGHNVTIVVGGSQGGGGQKTKEENRAAWSGKMQFFLSIIGYSVGLGNIWRFPYLCQQNGGGAFLIPFFVMLILEGVPLFLIELGVGQKMRQGALGVWNTIHPWLGGIGIASCIVTFFVALYYNVIIAWCFYYLVNSLQAVTVKFGEPLPWATCPMVNDKPVEECAKSSETAYFWYRTTLDAAPSIEDGQGLKWWIVVCLLVSWIIVFFIVMKGIQSSGKVVYFTSMFPYLVLTIFFIRGITLKGASAGLVHMYTPKVEMLLKPTVWLDAATQVFYSFGLAFGSLIAFGSYNTPDNNCVRDVILVSVCNAFTAIYASVVIFAILGFKAMSNVDKCIAGNKELLLFNGLLLSNSTDEQYEDIVTNFNSTAENFTIATCSLEEQLDAAAEGTGLAFIVFTQAIVELPGAPFWSCIFFLMLLALGLGSQIGILEGMLCVIFDIDLFKRVKKQYITAVVCVICFCVGLIFTTGAGEYWLKMFDSFAGTIGLVVVGLMEMVAVIYIYGHEKFTKDIEDMTGYRPGWYWQVTWRFLAPLIMAGILVSSIVCMFIQKPEYSAWDATKGVSVPTSYPGWVLVIAVIIVIAGVAPMPIVFFLRRFQCVKLDVDIHQGSIRRIDTTVSTKEMMGDVDLDEYHDRLEDFPEEEEDEDDNSDDDNNTAPSSTRMVANQMKGKAFKMEVMDF
ncbi:sodium- and chloride-dependent transporter XTRP3 isoform X1 [Neodiprion lecontei]|uniref:Transporter n=2 Tax=Neodiprion lecontei TaxID=441921 RepID=A0A6J0C426_NEOLC|nr:sodium- and chloride-dependent transporter XTRP3 isoform X1 [Neodiprion lecontei]